MKKLIEKLEKSLFGKGASLEITGEEMMKLYGISTDDMRGLCNKWKCELYDNMYVEASTIYAKEMRKFFEFNDEVCWYMNNNLEPKYITLGLNRIYKSCDIFMGDIYRKGNFENYSTSLKEIVNILKNIAVDKEIKLGVQYLYNSYIQIFIKDKEVINIKNYDFEGEVLEEESVKMLMYQLIILSHDVSLKETLSLIKLV